VPGPDDWTLLSAPPKIAVSLAGTASYPRNLPTQ
jgi:hypothetical protein